MYTYIETLINADDDDICDNGIVTMIIIMHFIDQQCVYISIYQNIQYITHC